MTERYQQNTNPIRVATSPLHNAAGTLLTGLADVTLRIQRRTDGFWLDWNDGVFKSSGWTTLDGAMAALDATRAPGVYFRDWNTTGFADDDYYARATSPSAVNVPQQDTLIVGFFVDNLDAASSTLATAAALATVQADTDDIQARLPATLSSGRMRSQVEGMDAGTVSAAAVATDAIDGDAIAASAVSEIQSGLATSATQTLHTAALVAINADTDDIQTRLPSSLSSGRMRSQVEGIDAGVSAALVDAVWDEVVSSSAHFGTDSAGEGIVLARGLMQQNFVLDNTVYNAEGLLTAGRIRIFATAAATAAATVDAPTDEGAIARFDITTTAETLDPILARLYKVARGTLIP